MLARPGTISRALVHATDWLPTLVRAAGGDPATLPRLDGVDQWAGLVRGAGRGPRREMLYNIDPLRDGDSGPNAAIRWEQWQHSSQQTARCREGHYKLILGDPGRPSGWVPPPRAAEQEDPHRWDTEAEAVLLFDLHRDPCERRNLASRHPGIVAKLRRRLRWVRGAGGAASPVTAAVQAAPGLHAGPGHRRHHGRRQPSTLPQHLEQRLVRGAVTRWSEHLVS